MLDFGVLIARVTPGEGVYLLVLWIFTEVVYYGASCNTWACWNQYPSKEERMVSGL